jgi:hypothetical protein
MKRCACLGLAALALAACGGNGDARLSKSAYEAKLRAALARPLVVAHSPPTAAIDSLGDVAARFGDIAVRLSGVRAPTDVQVLNDRLVAGAARTSATLQALGKRIQAASPAKQNALLAQFDASHIEGLDRFDRATAALAAKGYAFSPNGGT